MAEKVTKKISKMAKAVKVAKVGDGTFENPTLTDITFKDGDKFFQIKSYREKTIQALKNQLSELSNNITELETGMSDDLKNYVDLASAQTIKGQKTFSAQIIADGGVKGNVTGNVTGNVSGSAGSCTGNSKTATTLQSSRKINLKGDATGNCSFNGGADSTITVTLANSGVTAGNVGPASAGSVGFGGTIQVPYLVFDSKGRITSAKNNGIKLPAAPTSVSGNAGSATKLANKKKIDGVNFDGSADVSHFGTCSTAAATAAKTVALANFALTTGSRVIVKFTVTNTAANPTLNVNNTGAKAIKYRNGAISAGYLAANRVYEFVYDGADWELVGDIDTNTTYSVATEGEATAGSNNTKMMTPLRVKQAIDNQIGDLSALPTGSIVAYMGKSTAIPAGFLLCNGSNVSRTTYKALFNVIGTTCGAGNGSTTFTLPKLNDGRFLEGSTAPGTKRNAGLPNIIGVYPYTWPQENLSGLTYQGAAYEATVSSYKGWGASSRIASGVAAFGFDASKSNGLYGDSSKVQPVSLTTLFIIRI